MVNGVERKMGGPIIPALRYRDAAKAIEWLCDVFGFQKKMVVAGEDGGVAHAELTLGNGMIMLGDAETEYGNLVEPPRSPKRSSPGIYVVVEDADVHYAQAKAGGAEIVFDIKTQDYGGRDYTVLDLEGHVWTFGTYDPWLS